MDLDQFMESLANWQLFLIAVAVAPALGFVLVFFMSI